jgi:hypothetical protein
METLASMYNMIRRTREVLFTYCETLGFGGPLVPKWQIDARPGGDLMQYNPPIRISFGLVNAYLLRGDKGDVLIDTGLPWPVRN